jgi:pentapeptide repeat protein
VSFALAPSPTLLLAIGVICVLVLLALAFFVLPGRFVGDLPDLGPPPPGDRIALKDQFTLRADHEKRRNDLRTGLLQAVAGLAVIATLFTTLFQLQANQKQATDQQDLARRGQIADRFTKAIDQLGNVNNLDVRLGGIYGLEQIARDSRDDRTRLATYEVLTAYVREHAPWNPSAAVALENLSELQARAPDIQAVMTVLGRRDVSTGDPTIDLHGVDLRRANLESALLDRAELRGVHLDGANLDGAHLERTQLYEGSLVSAQLRSAHLEAAGLWYVHLNGANLVGAHLEGAGLFTADLEGASLGGAHMERAQFVGTYLKGAFADRHTTWPTGFDWRARGVQSCPDMDLAGKGGCHNA